MQTIRIILSADKSLTQERQEISDLVENLNHSLESRGANILMLAWDSAEENHEEFKDKISDTDLCLTLYYDTFAEASQAELETAYQALCEGKNPKKIYVYFKDAENVPAQLQEFRDSFPTKYGHFYCSFSNIDTLKADFLLQFMEYQSKNLGSTNVLEVRNGKVVVDGKEYVDLKNVPFAGNNEEYKDIHEEIEELKEDLEDLSVESPKYAKKAEKLNKLKEKLAKLEASLWDTALMITRLSTTKCSERLKRAMDLFNAGDNKGAQAVLNEEEIEKDVEHNLHLIQLGEEGKKGLKINIEEYQLKIKTLENEMSEGWGEQVLALHQKIVILNKTIYGEQSPEYAYALLRQGLAFSLLGKHNDALECHNLSLCILNMVFGVKHPDYATVLNCVGYEYGNLGDYQKALEYLQKALEIRIDIFGEHHPDTATSLNNVGLEYGYLGEYQRALDYFLKALEIRVSFYGEKHPEIANTMNNIGCMYEALGDYQKALEYAYKTLEMRQDLFGIKHPDTAYSYNHLGAAYCSLGNHQKALDYELKALEILRSVFGEKHPNTASSFDLVGGEYSNLGDHQKALEYMLKALDIREKVFGEDHPDIARSLNNVGTEYGEIGEYGKALEYLSHALNSYVKILGVNHPNTANVYHNLGWIHENLCDYEKALDYSKKALEIKINILGENHLDTAFTYGIIANIHRLSENLEEALASQIKRENILHNIDGPMYAFEDCYRMMAILKRNLRNYTDAIIDAKIALEYGKKAYIDRPSWMANTYSCLANCQKEAGEIMESLQNYHIALELYMKSDCQEDIKITNNRISEIEKLI